MKYSHCGKDFWGLKVDREEIERYLEIARLLGKRVVKTDTCWWEEARRFGYIPAPAGLPISVPSQDIRAMFWEKWALALRFFSSCSMEGEPTFYHACKDHHYNLSSLRSEARRKVLRGLKYCHVRELEDEDFSILVEEGLKIHQSALVRQKRIGQDVFRDFSKWRQLLEAYKRISEVRIYGAFVRNQLCAYLAIFQFNRLALYLHSFSRTEFLRYYPNNALLFYTTQHVMKNPEIEEFYIGLESLSSMETLHAFTLNMGFQRFPIWQQLILHPLLTPITQRWTRALINLGATHLRLDYLVAANDFLKGLKPPTHVEPALETHTYSDDKKNE